MTFTEVSSTFRISDLLTPFALLWRKAHYKTLKREIALGGNNARKRNLVSEVFARKRKLISWKMSRKRTVKESATTDPPLRPLCSLRLKNETTHPLTQSQTHNYPFRSLTRTRVSDFPEITVADPFVFNNVADKWKLLYSLLVLSSSDSNS